MVTKICDFLYLGDINDAKTFDGEVIMVAQDTPRDQQDHSYWIPCFKIETEWDKEELIHGQDVEVKIIKNNIDLVIQRIRECGKYNEKILIHCIAGIERSPLIIAKFLHDYNGMNWDEAYDYIQKKRPEVQNRLQWLNMTYDERMS